jgi:hypothetical protein
MASGQIRHGDCIRVSHREGSAALLFFYDALGEMWDIAGRAAA